MTDQELSVVLGRLRDEFGPPGPPSSAYRRHLTPLDAADVNAALDACVSDGLFSRPVPGDIMSRLPKRAPVSMDTAVDGDLGDPADWRCYGCGKKHNPQTSNGLAHCPVCQREREAAWEAKRAAPRAEAAA